MQPGDEHRPNLPAPVPPAWPVACRPASTPPPPNARCPRFHAQLDKDERRLLLLSALLFPLRELTTLVKGRPAPVAGHIVREALKWRNKDVEGVAALLKEAPKLAAVHGRLRTGWCATRRACMRRAYVGARGRCCTGLFLHCSVEQAGCSYAQVGCSYAQVVRSYTQVVRSYTQVGCSYAQVGCSYAQVGCSYAQVGVQQGRLPKHRSAPVGVRRDRLLKHGMPVQ
jgi:hypothetical protein